MVFKDMRFDSGSCLYAVSIMFNLYQVIGVSHAIKNNPNHRERYRAYLFTGYVFCA